MIIIFFELIEIGIEKYKTLGKVFCTGDFNSRNASLPDRINLDRYLDAKNLNYQTLFTSRLVRIEIT